MLQCNNVTKHFITANTSLKYIREVFVLQQFAIVIMLIKLLIAFAAQAQRANGGSHCGKEPQIKLSPVFGTLANGTSSSNRISSSSSGIPVNGTSSSKITSSVGVSVSGTGGSSILVVGTGGNSGSSSPPGLSSPGVLRSGRRRSYCAGVGKRHNNASLANRASFTSGSCGVASSFPLSFQYASLPNLGIDRGWSWFSR